jgi:hypothetical protein
MAETTADVRRDIELTRERMSDTLAQLEQKVNVMQIIRDHPWPALAIALGAGFALAGTKVDAKAAAATLAATGGASSRVGTLLDDVAARVISGASEALNSRIDGWVDELKTAIGAGEARPRTDESPRNVPGAPRLESAPDGAYAARPAISETQPRARQGQDWAPRPL